MLRQLFAKLDEWLANRRRDRAARRRREIDAFLNSRTPQCDEAFCRDCLTNWTQRECDWALGVRRAIATQGDVTSEYIHSDDTFFTLERLPGWANRIDLFDTFGFIALVESEIRIEFSDREWGRLPGVEDGDKLRVREFVRAVVDLCGKKSP